MERFLVAMIAPGIGKLKFGFGIQQLGLHCAPRKRLVHSAVKSHLFSPGLCDGRKIYRLFTVVTQASRLRIKYFADCLQTDFPRNDRLHVPMLSFEPLTAP